MLKHGRAGVPLEVMGLMLGDFVDEFTIRVIGNSFSPLSSLVRTHTDKGVWRVRCIRDASEWYGS